MTKTFTPKTQIAYVPTHTKGDVYHRDVKFGFVTSQRNDTVFCRYFYSFRDGGGLRTKSNSEGTPIDYLVPFDHRPEAEIERCWEKYVAPYLIEYRYTKEFKGAKGHIHKIEVDEQTVIDLLADNPLPGSALEALHEIGVWNTEFYILRCERVEKKEKANE